MDYGPSINIEAVDELPNETLVVDADNENGVVVNEGIVMVTKIKKPTKILFASTVNRWVMEPGEPLAASDTKITFNKKVW